MSGNSKKITIKLNLSDHKKLKVQSAKEGLFLNEKVEGLIEDYVFGAVKLELDNFKLKQKNIKLVTKVYDKVKERIEEDSHKKDKDKKRSRTMTNVAKGLIDKFILSRNSFDFLMFNKKMISFYERTYHRKNPTKNKTVSFNMRENMARKMEYKINNSRDSRRLNEFQNTMEVLFYAYAENIIGLDNNYFEKKHISIKLDNEFYKNFKDSLKKNGSKFTIQRVGESLIKNSFK